MKRFVLSCCILALTTTMVFAQAAKKSVAPAKSTSGQAAQQSKNAVKNNFLGKVSGFDVAMQRNNKAVAQQSFEDLKMIMTDDLHSLKPKIVNAPNAAEKQKWTDVLTKKQAIYFEIINSASDMVANHDKMVKKYKEYAATL